MTLERPQSK